MITWIVLLTLWNISMYLLREKLLGRVERVLFPLSNEHRLEAYRFPLSWKEFWWRWGLFTLFFVGSIVALVILFIRSVEVA